MGVIYCLGVWFTSCGRDSLPMGVVHLLWVWLLPVGVVHSSMCMAMNCRFYHKPLTLFGKISTPITHGNALQNKVTVNEFERIVASSATRKGSVYLKGSFQTAVRNQSELSYESRVAILVVSLHCFLRF